MIVYSDSITGARVEQVACVRGFRAHLPGGGYCSFSDKDEAIAHSDSAFERAAKGIASDVPDAVVQSVRLLYVGDAGFAEVKGRGFFSSVRFSAYSPDPIRGLKATANAEEQRAAQILKLAERMRAAAEWLEAQKVAA